MKLYFFVSLCLFHDRSSYKLESLLLVFSLKTSYYHIILQVFYENRQIINTSLQNTPIRNKVNQKCLGTT